MRFKIILLFALGFFIFSSLTYSYPPRKEKGDDYGPDTTRKKSNPDSLRAARAHAIDSAKEARTHIADSATKSRKRIADSIQAKRKHTTDSTAAIRKYRESKHYKDSVTRSRLKKTNAVKAERQSRMDSVKDVRKKITDSLTASRKGKTDSIKTFQKRRTDSLAKIKKYKESKRYTDSVSIVKHNRLDSIKNVQKTTRDRITKARKKSLDSATSIRKHSMDSIKTVRARSLDSIKVVRKKRVDSLLKVKADKEKLAKGKEKKKEDALKLKMELKIKKKHEAWSNKTMLKKRWSPVRRVLQNSFTHYNYYYNAHKKMEEANENMQRSQKENYDSLISLYPFDPNRDSTLLSADMDSIIRKVSVGIQIHDPRVKWSNDLYLLLGEAYYYRGNYENASIAFRYIISSDEARKKAAAKKSGNYSRSKEAPSILEDRRSGFLKHKSVHNEAILWLARTYISANQAENAGSVLSLLEYDVKLPEDLKGRLATEKALEYLAEGNYEEAAKQLAVTEDDKNLPDWLRMRAAFIHGQLLQNMGAYALAAQSFEKVLAYYPKLEMDFYARKYMAYNKLLAGQDVAEAMRPLKHVLNDGKYVSYYDQVYFVLGTLAAKAHNTDDAVKYLTKSTTTPKATKKQKALSFAALGDVYYTATNYTAAKYAYDSAAKYASAASKDNTVASAIQKSKGLEDISGPMQVIHDQDSLMNLSQLSRKEQQSVVHRYLRYLEKKQQDSITAAESTGVTSLAPVEKNDGPPDASGANWYFGNPTLMQQGSFEFKRKWGNRPLADNWRRTGANSLVNNNGGQNETDDYQATNTQESGMPTEESLMAKIPNTPQQKELSAKVVQRAYMLLAKAYARLENYTQAIHALDTLDSRFPNHNLKEDALYLRYQIALKQNQLDKAQTISQQLLTKFPNSQYANSLRPKQSESKGDVNGKTVAAYYDETYSLLTQHQFTEVLMHVNVARQQYDHPTFKKRFDIAEAMANAGMGEYDKADTLLAKFLKAYPTDTLVSWAKEVQIYVKEVRNGGKPSWYKETPPGSEPPAVKPENKPVTPVAPAPVPPPVVSNIPDKYSYHADSEHYCIVVLPGVDSRTPVLKKDIKALAASKYAANGLDMLLDLYNIDQGVLVIRKFANATLAKAFMNDLLASPAFHDYIPGEIQVMTITTANYRKMFSDRDATPYIGFYKAYYK